VLGSLVAAAEVRAAALSKDEARLREAVAAAPPAPSMAAALLTASVAVIAELKRRSPSRGAIRADLSAAAQVAAYGEGGAAALSVLTEPEQFGGSPADLREARRTSALPILRKDFHVSELQLLEARVLGASAVLLIARALPPSRLRELAVAAAELQLETLVEVRDERELADALSVRASMIGVNNRDLETLAIDPATAERLIPLIPRDRIAIAESGISARADVERFAACGADAVLVGSSVSASGDPVQAVRSLAGVARRGRLA
jgi:indole-3-glycerol phosphate synthase